MRGRVRTPCAEMSGGGECEDRHWGLQWNSPWGHETSEGCAEICVVDACGEVALGREHMAADGDGNTPSEFARLEGHADLASRLREAETQAAAHI